MKIRSIEYEIIVFMIYEKVTEKKMWFLVFKKKKVYKVLDLNVPSVYTQFINDRVVSSWWT